MKRFSKLEVDLSGGFLKTVYDADNQPFIFFPQQLVDGKQRGGSHVCLPNFGPDSSDRFAQHGYGRLSQWEAVEMRDSRVVLDLIPEDQAEYSKLKSTITYEIVDDSTLYLSLESLNNGDLPLRYAPALHPYFSISGSVSLDGEKIDPQNYLEAQFIEGAMHNLQSNLGEVNLESNSDVWAVWSGHPDKYLCIEPSLAGNAFLDGENTPVIEPGQSQTIFLKVRLEG